MTSNQPVVFYCYSASPFATKIDNVLYLKNIPHSKVNVNMTLPRPELELIGVSYRRIPVLAIGNDVYCDTSLIASVLERRFPPSAGFGTIFPPRNGSDKADTGLIKVLARHYTDTVLFPKVSGLLQWDRFPESFLKDRMDFDSRILSADAMKAMRPHFLSNLSSQLLFLEEQLSDGREWVFDTTKPGLADISFYFIYGWAQRFRTAQSLLIAQRFPHVSQWLQRCSNFFGENRRPNSAPCKTITGAEAAKMILSSPHQPIVFDKTEATQLGLKEGSIVAVAPDDTGRNHPTLGKLVGLTGEEVVIETQGRSSVRVHFPRILFSITSTHGVKNKL